MKFGFRKMLMFYFFIYLILLLLDKIRSIKTVRLNFYILNKVSNNGFDDEKNLSFFFILKRTLIELNVCKSIRCCRYSLQSVSSSCWIF